MNFTSIFYEILNKGEKNTKKKIELILAIEIGYIFSHNLAE